MSKKVIVPPRLSALAASCLLATSVGATDAPVETPATETQTVVTEPVDDVSIGRSANVEGRLSSEFSEFLGGEESAARVVEGLRTGRTFTLGGDVPVDPGTDPGTVPPPDSGTALPTGTMGYGNVRITLKLAEARLAQMGISQPTDEQLSAVLLGGDVDGVALDGILTARAAGAGWGEIARQYDLKVGQLMGNGKAPINAPGVDDGGVPVDPEGPAPGDAEAGVVAKTGAAAAVMRNTGKGHKVTSTADGDTSVKHDPSTTQRRANGYIPSGAPRRVATHSAAHGAQGRRDAGARGNGYIAGGAGGKGGGIVTATGAAVAAGGPSGNAKGHFKADTGSATRGGAIVSAGNASAAAAASHAGGNGLAKGHAKGKP